MDNLHEFLSSFSGGRVLDVATGRGNFIPLLLEYLPGCTEIVGIDNAPGPLDAARAALPRENVRFLQMDAEQLDLPAESFDTACISNSLHHVTNLPRVLAEMKRVLKPGGHFLIAEMYRDGQAETQLTHVYLHHWWAEIDRAGGIPHGETYTRQEVVELAQGLGLESLVLYDHADLAYDPLGPELVQELTGVVERYIQRAAGLPGEEALKRRGEELRERVKTIGFHSATTLFCLGQKPSKKE